MQHVDSDTVRSFVDRFEGGDRHEAVSDLLETAEEPRSVLTSLFGVGYDGWYALVADDISGRCLDLAPGWGRTTPLLAALADTVYSHQPTDAGRRLLESRPGLEGGDVVSTGADDLESALSDRSYDTIVATGPRPPDDGFVEHVDRLADALTDGGTLVTEIDGWPRTTALTDRLGPAGSKGAGERSLSTIRRSVPAAFVDAMADRGFAAVDLYGLLPGGRRYRWAVPVDDPDAIEWVLETIETDAVPSSLLRAGATVANRVGLLKQSYPSYVAVCHTEPTPESAGPSDDPTRVVRRGANRSIVFELADGDVETVRKVPNAPRHGRFNERAATTLSSLSTGTGPLDGTLPDVSLAASPFGPSLLESPASGTPLMDVAAQWETPPDPDAFGRILRTGLDWIRTLQVAHAGPRRTLSPEEARRELAPTAFDVTPPSIDGPIAYPTVPAHGDYHPGNVLVADDGSIERVIDWEYSRLESNPVADPAFYVLKLAEFAFGGFEAGVRATLIDETPYSIRVVEQVIAYCDEIGIRPRTFGAYLGHALVTQTDVHFESESPWRFHANPREKCERLRFLYDSLPTIRSQLEGDRTDGRDRSPPAVDASSAGVDGFEPRDRNRSSRRDASVGGSTHR